MLLDGVHAQFMAISSQFDQLALQADGDNGAIMRTIDRIKRDLNDMAVQVEPH